MNHDVFFPAQYKEMGYQPHVMVNYLALLGWGDGTENEFFTIDDLGLFLIVFSFRFHFSFCILNLK
jgi:glutamyl-tRNA synthetase